MSDRADYAFCATCYLEGIDRLIAGFSWTADGRMRYVEPLDVRTAIAVRRVALEVLAERGTGRKCHAHQNDYVAA
jgi:hypothetical protein